MPCAETNATHGDCGTRAETKIDANDADDRDIIELVKDLPARDLDRRARIADRRTEVGTRELAFYLADMDERRVHQLLGYSTTVEYAVRRLEMSRRHARELIAIGRALDELPAVDEAFCEGRLKFGRVRLLIRIAVPETERAWLDRALESTWTDFQREVATGEKGRPPRKNGRGLPHVRLPVKGMMSRLAFEEWELARRQLEDERGERFASDGEFMQALAEMLLSKRPDGSIPGRTPTGESIYHVVVDRCDKCRESTLATEEGPAEIDPSTLEMICCDASERDLTGSRGTESDEGKKSPPLPDWLRRRILSRDRFRCRICSSSEQMMVHHIFWRSWGGKNPPSNLMTLCFRCHGLVHEDLLFIKGTAPHALELSDRDGNALAASKEELGALLQRLGPRGGPERRGMAVDAAVPGAEPHQVSHDPTAGEGRRAPVDWEAAAAFGSPVTIRTLPAGFDERWWRRHAHLFSWNDRRGVMEFEEGTAADWPTPALAGPPEGRAASPKLDDLVGQARVRHSLRTGVAAARVTGRAVDHVLLSGPPGLGKTTLATAMAADVGAGCQVLSGPLIRDPGVLIGHLVALKPRDVLFIDEIHALPRKVAETLLEAMQESRLSLSVTDGHHTVTLRAEVSPFTLVGATTELGKIPAPLLSRFTLREHLELYSEADLSEILSGAAAPAGLDLEPAASARIARMAHGVPRDAIMFFRRVRNAAEAGARKVIDAAFAKTTFDELGIDETGLGPIENSALAALRRNGQRPMGIARWAATAGVCTTVLRQLCEPALVRLGLMAVTPRGRVAV